MDIIVYVETLNQAKQWVADNRHTFEIATADGNQPWPEMLPNYQARNEALAGLLCMGASKLSYPFSFAQRSFPQNASAEVTAVFLENTQVKAVSYLARQELESKGAALMILPDQRALTAKPHLDALIQELPEPPTNRAHQRIVFWFDK
jgi:hypothetical protein